MKRLYAIIFALFFAAALRAQDAPEKYGWSFRNFSTAVFYWDIYRNAMFGIPEDSSGLTAPFDLLFYNEVFKVKLAGGAGGGGNCYGLSLLSLVMNKDGGHLGYCCPTNFYGGVSGTGPTDPKLTRAINIMHGHQVTLACIQSFFDQALNGHSQNASYAVALAQQTLSKEGPFVVSVTKALSPSDGGHTLIGYKVESLGGSHYKIYVVDVNRIWADSTTPDNRDFYVAGNNFIDCNGPTWSYNMGGSLGVWPTGNGHLTVLPETIAAPTGRVPSSLGLAVGELLNKIFIAHDGEGATITQIRNAEGKRLFLPGSKQIDWDTKSGLRTIVPWFPSSRLDGKPFQFETYFHFGALQNAEVVFYSGTKGARIAIGDNTGYVYITCHDADVHATIAVSGLASSNPSIVIKHTSKAIHCDIDILIPVKKGEINRVFSVHDFVIPAGENSFAECDITNAENIRLNGNSGHGATFTVSQNASDKSKEFSTKPIFFLPSNGPTWKKEDWELLKLKNYTGK